MTKKNNEAETKTSNEIVNIRVYGRTRTILKNKLKGVKDKCGKNKKLNFDDLILAGLDSIPEDKIQKLILSTFTQDDKEKLIFERYKKAKKASTWDQFKSDLFLGKAAPFIQENCSDLL